VAIISFAADTMWIENLNSLLDESRMLCLANRERIRMSPNIAIVFEVDQLDHVTPSIITRCGVVHVDSSCITWNVLCKSWSQATFTTGTLNSEDSEEVLLDMKDYVDTLFQMNRKGFEFLRTHAFGAQGNLQTEAMVVRTQCALLGELLKSAPLSHVFTRKAFLFSYVWAFGGGLLDPAIRSEFDTLVRGLFDHLDELDLPRSSDVFSWGIHPTTRALNRWDVLVPKIEYTPGMKLGLSTLHNVDLARHQYLTDLLIRAKQPFLLYGPSGVGKSFLMEAALQEHQTNGDWMVAVTRMSPRTSLERFRGFVDGRLLASGASTEISGVATKKLVIFVDNMNIIAPDQYGAQVNDFMILHVCCRT
jgi:dynein heavy chain, axonemal